MNFAELDRAARIWAAKAPFDIRQDVYQSAWIRFLRYPPVEFAGAFVMARCALFDLLKREQRQRLVAELHIYIEGAEPPDDTAYLIDALRRLCPEETEDLLRYYGKQRPNGAERIHAMRLRRIIKQKLKGD